MLRSKRLPPTSALVLIAIMMFAIVAEAQRGRQRRLPRIQPPGMFEDNERQANWGAADTPLLRSVPSENADGISEPSGADRPSARLISNIVMNEPEPLLRGLAQQRARRIDTFVTDAVRNLLFGAPGAGGFDLASLNSQRGRDHGLPDYNSARHALGLAPKNSFGLISSNPDTQQRPETAYGSVDAIDPWGWVGRGSLSRCAGRRILLRGVDRPIQRLRAGG